MTFGKQNDSALEEQCEAIEMPFDGTPSFPRNPSFSRICQDESDAKNSKKFAKKKVNDFLLYSESLFAR